MTLMRDVIIGIWWGGALEFFARMTLQRNWDDMWPWTLGFLVLMAN